MRTYCAAGINLLTVSQHSLSPDRCPPIAASLWSLGKPTAKRNQLGRNVASGPWRWGIAADHHVPIGPRAFIDDPRWRAVQCFAEVIRTEIAPHYGDVLDRAIGHQIGEKADRIGQCLFGGLEPDHAR